MGSLRPPSIAGNDKALDRLIGDIRSGNCVAFVGAGFVAPAVPQWRELLGKLNKAAPKTARDMVSGLIATGSSAQDLETAAQLLRDAMPERRFQALLQKSVSTKKQSKVADRLTWLRGIPFRSILTTNFDPLIAGDVPGRDAYLKVLRSESSQWTDDRFWRGVPKGADVVKLHGDVARKADAQIVFSRQDYRKLLHGNPAYLTFLRSVFATRTVFYFGFSFTDAYLDELRSEILALLEHRDGVPIAYTIGSNVSVERQRYYRKHEGLEILSYKSEGGDFAGFDDYLRTIHDETNPLARLGLILEGKRILWLDKNKENNDDGMRLLRKAAKKRCKFAPHANWESAVKEVRRAQSAGEPYDLLITHWGHAQETLDGSVCAVAERVLTEIRKGAAGLPAIVFASRDHANENKRRALRLGAAAFTFEWPHLFREIERVFAPATAE